MGLPTLNDFEDASMYAQSKLCQEIYGKGNAKWNGTSCVFTESGCKRNSEVPYTRSGRNKRFLKYEYFEYRDGQCKLGNHLMRKWCEIPANRTGENGSAINGITNSPALTYDEKTGLCKVNKKYCRAKGLDYKNEKCYMNVAQRVSELIFGTTITRRFKQHNEEVISALKEGRLDKVVAQRGDFVVDGMDITDKSLDKAKGFLVNNTVGQIPGCNKTCQKVFQHAPIVGSIGGGIKAGAAIGKGVKKLFSDPRLKMNEHILVENYGGNGIHLYTFEWNSQGNQLGLYGTTIGFMADEVEKVYPKYVTNENGYKQIIIDKQMCDSNKNYNRICVIEKNKDSLYNFFNMYI